MKKRKKILIALVIILASIVVLCSILFSNAILIRMPSSYICKQLEKDVPIGTSAEEVIKYVESNDKWTNYQLYVDRRIFELEDYGLQYSW